MTMITSLDSERRRVTIVAVALLLLLVVSTPLLLWFNSSRSSAAFADSEVLATNHLGAGTLDLEIGEKTMTFDAKNLAPGDTVSGHLELVNAGTLPIVLEISGTSDDDLLASWLRFDLWQTASTCSPADLDPRFASDLVLTSRPTVLLNVAQQPSADHARLAVGQSAVFCLGARLLLEAPNDVQGRRTEIDLAIHAIHDIEAENIEAGQ